MKNFFYKNKNLFGGFLFSLIVIAIVTAIYFNDLDKKQTVPYNEFLNKVTNNQVHSVTISDSQKISFTLKNNEGTFTTDNPRKADLKEMLLLNNVLVSEGGSANSYLQSIMSMLFFVAAFYFIYRNMNKQNVKGAMAFNMQDYNENNEVLMNFSNIAGNEEAKDSVLDVVEFIKNPEKYEKYGARMPRGLLFYGPPGTGKTLMAKAIAGEAGVSFFAVSGSDFVQMYVGVGASRIRELFRKAREAGKAVIFIDEIDAIGKKRSSGAAGSNDERDQTLNALLTEMSGFSSGEGIVVIAATNRLDTLDDALLRPGRFDRQVEIGLPDLSARERILTHHALNKPISNRVDLKRLSKSTVYFSGAMLENLLNEAAIFAANREADCIDDVDIEKAYYTVIAGSEKKDRSAITELSRRITAYHEAGHALVAKLTSPHNTVSKITIIPSTKGAGGFCINIPQDKMYYTKKELYAQVMINLAGRAAEELIFGEENVTTGAGNDIEKATSIIKDIITKYGMSDKTGLINTHILNMNTDIVNECMELTKKLYDDTKNLLMENMHILNSIVDELLLKESLHEEELDHIIHVA